MGLAPWVFSFGYEVSVNHKHKTHTSNLNRRDLKFYDHIVMRLSYLLNLARWWPSLENWTPYASIGVDTDVRVTAETDHNTDSSFIAGLGLIYHFTFSWHINLNYQYFFHDNAQLRIGGKNIADAWSKNQITLGFGYDF